MAIKASPAGGNHELVPVNTPEPRSDYTLPWKQTALEKRSPKMNSTADTGAVPSSETLLENIPKWKFELMKKKGLVKADHLVTPKANGKPEETTPKPRQTPPRAKLSVQDRVNKFSSPTEETNDAVSPWVARSKTPLVRYEVKETYLVQSAHLQYRLGTCQGMLVLLRSHQALIGTYLEILPQLMNRNEFVLMGKLVLKRKLVLKKKLCIDQGRLSSERSLPLRIE
jgi:hypothetical protein